MQMILFYDLMLWSHLKLVLIPFKLVQFYKLLGCYKKRFPWWHSKIQRLFDLLVWKDTHFHVKFDLETPNCLPIIANNPDNCNDFPVIFKVICQNWEFTNLFLHWQKNQSLAKRWWWIFKNWALTSFFLCIDIQSVALQSGESCTLTPPMLPKWFSGCSKEAGFAKMTY